MDFCDTDALIVEKEKKSINDIFRENGEPYFREDKIIALIAHFSAQIRISFSRTKNRLAESGKCFSADWDGNLRKWA